MPVRPRRLDTPRYDRPEDTNGRSRVGLAVESMRRHMTDEGWQLFEGLEGAGYTLYGHGLQNSSTSLHEIVKKEQPITVVMQDKREWDVRDTDFRDPEARFAHLEVLRNRPDIFKLTILKDAQQRPIYHKESAEEIGCHGWIVYYHPKSVTRVATYVREEDLVRTYHTVDPSAVPEYSPKDRLGCLLSGAVSDAYPLRTRLFKDAGRLPDTIVLNHPGYHRNGCHTPGFLQTLSRFKVAICTASIYGYALRKIIEATACGCIVITDLPSYDILPEINENLIRIPTSSTVDQVARVIRRAVDEYDPELQERLALTARCRYSLRVEGSRLANEIEELRLRYEQ